MNEYQLILLTLSNMNVRLAVLEAGMMVNPADMEECREYLRQLDKLIIIPGNEPKI